VLVIAYYYPPLLGGGSLRPFRLANHLSRRGHAVAVLTHTYGRDQLAGPVIRVHDPSFNCRRVGLGRLRWLLLRGLTEGANRVGSYSSIYGRWKARVLKRLDPIVESFQPSVVVASYSPVETLELGVEVATRHGLPLGADFRDGLLFEPIESSLLRRHQSVRTRYEVIEERVVRQARAIVAAHPPLASYFVERYRAANVALITNAYDPDDFKALPPIDLEPGRVHVVHAGGFAASDASCDIGPFVDGLRASIEAEPDLAARLRLHQLGRLTAYERRLLRPLAETGVLVDHGVVDRGRCLGMVTAADLLLLLTSVERSGVAPSKLYEYLYAGRPIIAVCEGTFAAKVVRETGAGWVVSPADSEAIASLILRVAGVPAASRSVAPDHEAVEAYSVQAQIDRWIAVLEDASAHSRCGS
jgi:glycosyltransferase involved in cell wall biosynthesis